jgi:RNA polymerase sigma-70 factor (ECF subfamily)
MMADEADRRMVAGLRRGEDAAFEETFEFYRPRIYGFLARLTRERSLAEDLLQETWLRLARCATRLDADTDLGAWLFTVARNLFVSHRRWHIIDFQSMTALRRAEAGEQPSPFDLASAGETERRIEAALGGLHQTHREVLLLVCVEGLEPGRVASILGISPEALRQRLARARNALAAELGGRKRDAQTGEAR